MPPESYQPVIIQKATVSIELGDFPGGCHSGTSAAIGEATKESGDAPNWSPLPKALADAAERHAAGRSPALVLLAQAVRIVATRRRIISAPDQAIRALHDAAVAFLKSSEK